MTPKDVVVRFLDSLGRREEARYYLELFRDRPRSFAVIRVSADLSDVARDALELDLRFLSRLDLHPVVLEASEADIAAVAATARDVRARKVVLLGAVSSLGPSLVDVATEYDDLMARLSPDLQAPLRDARALLDAVAHPMNVAITSPLSLLRELFTERGAGTLVRRGAAIARHLGYEDVDRARLDAVIQSAFGAAPLDAFFARPVERVYVAGDYDGVAIVAPTQLVPYLTKFAVDQRARGEGIGRDLWRAVTGDFDRLLWRCRTDNPIAGWYTTHCEGMIRTERWIVFWRGLATEQLPAAIDLATATPADFPPSSAAARL